MRRLGLRGRMVALAVSALALVLAVGGLAFQSVLRGTLRSTAVAAGEAHLDEVAAALQDGRPPPLYLRGADALVQVVPEDGPVRGTGPAAVDAPRLPPGQALRLRRGSLPGAEPDNDYLLLGRGVRTPQGPVTAYVGVAVDAATDPADSTRTIGLLLGAVVLVGVGATARVLVGRTLAPVERMRASAEAISGPRVTGRVEVPPGDDEVARLGHTLNAVLARVERAQQVQRRFVADAAHELRSPLASLRAQLEAPPGARVVGDLLAELDRVERLVESLLLLSRSDLQALPLRRRPVDLDEVVVAAARRAQRRWGVHVDVRRVAPAQVLGDVEMLDQVLGNLLDNACRHARSRVEVVLHDGAPVRLSVDDDGPGIPQHERERVFARFARVGDARSRSDGGTGLGLAIVRELVEAHGGAVAADSSPLGGARLRVDLPPGAGVPTARRGRSRTARRGDAAVGGPAAGPGPDRT